MIAFADPLYEAPLLRALGHAPYGGAELGECLAAAATMVNRSHDSWYRGWMTLADRVFAVADASAAAGHHTSAERAYLRASNYYRTAFTCARHCRTLRAWAIGGSAKRSRVRRSR